MLIDKGNHRHFMAKEIYEQPEVVGHTLANYIDMAAERVALPMKLPFDFTKLQAHLDRRLRHRLLRRHGRANTGSSVSRTCRSRSISRRSSATATAPLGAGNLAIFVSQSGETADTLASLRYAREHKQHVLVGRQRADLDHRARERRGDADASPGRRSASLRPRPSPASWRRWPRSRSRPAAPAACCRETDEKTLVQALIEVPRHLAEALALEPQIEQLARDLAKCRDVLYLGRGTSYPLALEGALKLKEISYIHAEGYAAGELKHGPIALIDETMPVIVIAPHDQVFEKTVSNMQEVAARGGRLILMTDAQGRSAPPTQAVGDAHACRPCRRR